MRVFITGNMGYVGPVVVAHLRNRLPTAFLTGCDVGWFAHCLTTSQLLPETALDEQRFMDVRDVTASDLVGFDVVVHLAAVSNDPMGARFEEVTDEINHRASYRVACAAAEAGVKKFIFASSCSVYGFAEGGRPRAEDDALNPLTAYARSKVDTERAIRALSGSGMEVTCLRFATACGMAPRLRLDLVLNDFVAGALSSGRVDVLSDGTPWRPLIDVRDMARAIEWAAIRSTDQGGPFLVVNVGHDCWNYQVKDLAEAVGRAIPSAFVSIGPQGVPDKRSYRVDFSRFRQLAPEHQPLETLDDTIARLRDGLIEVGFADANYRSSAAIRLITLEKLIDTNILNKDLLPKRGGR
jgi:nucleoside-diphosphate-sugar epimerase